MMRLLPPIWVLISLAVMATLHVYFPGGQLIPEPYNLCGIALVVIGMSLIVWPALMFWRARTTIRPFHESSALVTSGPFRGSRNPIYVGMVLGLIGAAILFGSLTPPLVVPVFTLLIDRVFIVPEERMLSAKFAGEYDRYCQRVRRWI